MEIQIFASTDEAGALGDERSAATESFSREAELEGPQWTRPAEFRGLSVPETLRSGDHERIRRWREEESLKRTEERRGPGDRARSEERDE